jgi:hypothetical protein
MNIENPAETDVRDQPVLELIGRRNKPPEIHSELSTAIDTTPIPTIIHP